MAIWFIVIWTRADARWAIHAMVSKEIFSISFTSWLKNLLEGRYIQLPNIATDILSLSLSQGVPFFLGAYSSLINVIIRNKF